MGRVYMSYINDGQHGYTWLVLTALTMGAHGATHSNSAKSITEIAQLIWDHPNDTELPPILLRQQVNSCMNKLIDLGYAHFNTIKKRAGTHGDRYVYFLSPEGLKHFEPPSPDFSPSNSSDSKVFHPAGKTSKKVISIKRRRHRKVA